MNGPSRHHLPFLLIREKDKKENTHSEKWKEKVEKKTADSFPLSSSALHKFEARKRFFSVRSSGKESKRRKDTPSAPSSGHHRRVQGNRKEERKLYALTDRPTDGLDLQAS